MNSREISFLIIRKVLDDGATLDAAMEKYCKSITGEDRGFVRYLTTTTIRRLGQLDKIINHCTKTKLGNTQMAIRHVLRLGICQLLFTGVPPYAAVDMSVKLVDDRVNKKLHYLKNMVNAVLRTVDRDREALLKKFGNTRLNFPGWLLQSWDTRFGQGEVKKILAQVLEEAPLDIFMKADEDATVWADKLGGNVMPDRGVRLEKGGKVSSLPGYGDGVWWVQDFAARIPARLLGCERGDSVLDLCAAPGGKAAQSASAGVQVTAVDISESRLQRLHRNMERLKLEIDVVTSDVLLYKPQKNFDYIILDAPCSSTGTVRRHPELLHTRHPKNVKELSLLQEKMLDRAVSLLNTGGTLIYCVCSMQSEEGPDQIKALLERNRSLKRKGIKKEELPGAEQAVLETGDVQTLPHYVKGGMDGFFISRLTKI